MAEADEPKKLFVAATRQNEGKTTISLGLLAALAELRPPVGFIKPVGQRYVEVDGVRVDEDVALMSAIFRLGDSLQDMSPVTAAAELDAPADALVADVYDSGGQVIRRLDLGAHGPGLVSFEWDGRDGDGEWAAEGRYGLRVRALSADGESNPPTSVAQRVMGIERGSDGLKLRLEGGASVPESSVRAIF